MGFITAGDFKKGITFVMDDTVQVIVDFQHVKPGKGAAFVRTKIKNIMTGGIIEKPLIQTRNLRRLISRKRRWNIAITTATCNYFMDQETYDMVPISKDMVDEALKFIKENMVCEIAFFEAFPFRSLPKTLWNWKLSTASPAYPEPPLNPAQSKPPWRRDSLCKCLYS